LYGEEQDKNTKWDGDYRRSLMELGLIHQCFNKGIPLMSICRGFQMTSVYFGAKLHQHVGRGQVGVQILGKRDRSDMEEASPAGIYGNVVSGIRAAVYHHQAVPVNADLKHIGPSLTHTVTDPDHGKKWDVIMAVEQNSGAPILGLQFHPEFFKDNPSIQAPNADMTNDELIQIARTYQRPGRNVKGLKDPSDMANSGILEHMSPDNDDIWKILADAANTYRNKSAITAEVLLQQKEKLRETKPIPSLK
jgi:anthranilate/para-aminobenzoate synthase component II